MAVNVVLIFNQVAPARYSYRWCSIRSGGTPIMSLSVRSTHDATTRPGLIDRLTGLDYTGQLLSSPLYLLFRAANNSTGRQGRTCSPCLLELLSAPLVVVTLLIRFTLTVMLHRLSIIWIHLVHSVDLLNSLYSNVTVFAMPSFTVFVPLVLGRRAIVKSVSQLI